MRGKSQGDRRRTERRCAAWALVVVAREQVALDENGDGDGDERDESRRHGGFSLASNFAGEATWPSIGPPSVPARRAAFSLGREGIDRAKDLLSACPVHLFDLGPLHKTAALHDPPTDR